MNGQMARREFLRLCTTSLCAAVVGVGCRQLRLADEARGIVQVTRNNARLRIPPSTPAGKIWRYCISFPFQLAPRKAAVLCNIRGNHPGDFEVGVDVITFDDLTHFQADKAVPITRIEQSTNPNSQPPGEPCWLIKQWDRVGFIPLGAKRADGSPHPHAGTGFGINPVIAWPLRDKQAPPGADDRPSDPFGNHEGHGYYELHQFAYDGKEFRVLSSEAITHDRLLPGWSLGSGGLTGAIPDGDDLIIPFTGSRKGNGSVGLLRWRRQNGHWRPQRFVPALPGRDGRNSYEPSLVRDTDGAWLLAARGSGDYKRSLRVWRSVDGSLWKRLLFLHGVLPLSPVALHRATDGTLFIAANLISDLAANMASRFPLPADAAGQPLTGRIRETLCLWPLDVKHARLKPPLEIRDGRVDFGPPPGGITWTIDHPIAANLQLADGRWHTVLGYRVVDRAETARGFAPPPETGAYLEEVISTGNPIPAWRF